MTDETRKLLSEGLDLCTRARSMDAIDRREAAVNASKDPAWESSDKFSEWITDQNEKNPHAQIATKSGTVPMWLYDQYARDLADWERRARKHLEENAGADS
ncbi:hypothetical protein V6767_20415 [Martelella sp. FLE1502]